MTPTTITLCAAIKILGMSAHQEKRACTYMPAIVENSTNINIEPELLISLIFVESSFNPWVVSKAGACGLTQVIPKYTGKYSPVKKLSCKQLKSPKTSIYAGTRILRWWIKYHKGDVKKGLCGYNAGFRCKKRKPNKYGMKYARKVIRIRDKLIKVTRRGTK